jgi:CHAT domain
MKARTSVVDWSGNYEENCIQLGKHLGKNKIRRKLFDTIYGRGSKPRSKKQMMVAAGIRSGDAQQAQNQLDYLARYGLIMSEDNNGFVKDGSRYLYSKDPNVRAHRQNILKYADNPRLGKTVATKRNPVVRGGTVTRLVVTRQALKKRKKLNVLYLTANPDEQNALRVDAEVRQVKEAVRGSLLRENIVIHQSPAADLDSLIDGLNDYRPPIVHFSGHGYSGGLAVDHAKVKRPKGKVITFGVLGQALAATDSPPSIVVLNARQSAVARQALIPPAQAIVVMQDSISDLAAAAFSAKFYAAIAAGQSLKSAFEQGRVAVANVSLNEAATPVLMTANGVNPAKVILA